MPDPTTITLDGRAVHFVCHMALLSGTHRRNSLAAIRECFDAGAGRIEIDIHSLAGGDYAVFHDRRLETHTTGSGSIGKATADDFRALRWQDDPDDRPPLLSEIIALAAGSPTEMQLDLKDWRPLDDARLRALIEAVAPAGDRVIVSTGQNWNLQRLHRAAPDVRFGFDPNHYLDHYTEGSPFFMPRNVGAYGYRDDHPLAYGRTEDVAVYLRERWEQIVMLAPGAREYFLSYRLVLQMLGDGFNVADFLHERGIGANVWTLDAGAPGALDALRRLSAAGIDRVTTNTIPAWREAIGSA